MKTKITTDQFNELKTHRTDEISVGEKVGIVSRVMSTNNSNQINCSFMEATVVDNSGDTYVVKDDFGLELAICLNQGLSEFKVSKNYRYETFFVKLSR